MSEDRETQDADDASAEPKRAFWADEVADEIEEIAAANQQQSTKVDELQSMLNQ